MTLLTDDEKRTDWLDALHHQRLITSAVQKELVKVLSVVECPLTADEIWEETQRIRPETGRATVYRFIDKLTTAGVLRRVHGYRNCSAYIPAFNAYHPFLLCTSCGHVSYLDPISCEAIIKAVEATKQGLEDNYHVTGYQLQLFEVCITCQSDNS